MNFVQHTVVIGVARYIWCSAYY